VIIRVPLLLQPSVAVIHRLDISGTRAVDPPGEPDAGYDDTFRETIAYDDTATATRQTTRREMPPIRIPCQVEDPTEERLRQLGIGDDLFVTILLVLHRRDLDRLHLLDANRETKFKKGDRVSRLERYGAPAGTVVKQFASPGFFVQETRAGSWGFGPDGYDLEFLALGRRREGPTP
jgi:hypothetical protein